VGSVEISGKPGAARLEDLECVQLVTGDLRIYDEDLTSLEPLSSLVQVMGDFKLMHMPKLRSLEPLAALEAVGGDMGLEGLSQLKKLDGLGSLRGVGGDLVVYDNERLVDLHPLAPLFKSIHVYDNDALTRLEGFGAAQERDERCVSDVFDANIAIYDNRALAEVVLPANRGGYGGLCIDITGNASLTALSGEYGGHGALKLRQLPELRRLDLRDWRFDALEIDTTGLETLDGLESATVECELEVEANPNLEDISALFRSIVFARRSFAVFGNPKLATCELEAFADQLRDAVGQCVRYGQTEAERFVYIEDNDDTAVCE
jgi:hypothetical protein